MTTPIYNFVQEYQAKNSVRLHMPGHKGKVFLGCEPMDITEVAGADVLSQAQGIIGESQKNAAKLFGTGLTLYSTEGSSLSIKAMLAAAYFYRKEKGYAGRAWVLAARNVHRAMIDGCALLDLDVRFLPCETGAELCSVKISLEQLEETLEQAEFPPIGVYITSPDYLGQQADIAALAECCHKKQVPLLVDNAHGAYLAFLEESRHPIHLGADMCCDSAHKTLPVLTGGSYLQFRPSAEEKFGEYARRAMALFGSTSPSYLVLQSLDLCNRYLAEGYPAELEICVRKIGQIKEEMKRRNIPVLSGEPLKLVIDAAALGYTGEEIARELRTFCCTVDGEDRQGLECEYADEKYVVWMLTPENTEEDYECIRRWLKVTCLNEKKTSAWKGKGGAGVYSGISQRKLTIRQAMFSPSEMVPVSESVGRILAQETVSCPPAIPIGISGELITREMVEQFLRYGVEEVCVCKEH